MSLLCSIEWSEVLSGIAAAIIAAAISISVALIARRQDRKRLYADMVSNSRNTWLNEMRQYLSVMLAEARKAGNNYKSKEYYYSQNQVLLRLNETEFNHALLRMEIEALEKCNAAEYEDIANRIQVLAKFILKEEWERVKAEAKK